MAHQMYFHARQGPHFPIVNVKHNNKSFCCMQFDVGFIAGLIVLIDVALDSNDGGSRYLYMPCFLSVA